MPDTALGKSEVLVEQEETVVEKKVVDDTPYASAKSFEELGLSAELLQDRAVLLKSALQREHADPLFRVQLHRVRRQRRETLQERARNC